MTSTWIGAWGLRSWNARAPADRPATWAGISPAAIRQKMQSAMRGCLSQLKDVTGRGHGRRLESEDMRAQPNRNESGSLQLLQFGTGEAAFRANDDQDRFPGGQSPGV